jgi:hypothetical protein
LHGRPHRFIGQWRPVVAGHAAFLDIPVGGKRQLDLVIAEKRIDP